MKKNNLLNRISIFLFFLLLAMGASAQGAGVLDVTLDARSFTGGYNISCHGATDGAIDATVVGGTAPYTYSWSNGATTEDLSGIAAGTYSITVTDHSSNTVTKAITIYQADAMSTSLTPSSYSGFNISWNGGADGQISTYVGGGAPPYTYLWGNSDVKPDQTGLTVGSYSVTVTDQNGCISTQSIALTQPDPLHISYTVSQHNGYNITCAGGNDGSLTLTVTGGIPPYTYGGDMDDDPTLSNLHPGDYFARVSDNYSSEADTTITLTQPPAYTVALSTTTFANGHNTACFGCSDGTAEIASNTNGAHPYTYLWSNSQTSTSITNITAGTYSVTATDAHGCAATNTITLTDPAPNAWGKTGNTADTTEFMGTTNAVPMIFKTNGSERLRLTSAGNMGVGVVSPSEKLEVAGSIKASGDIKFGGTQTLRYSSATSGTRAILSFGGPIVFSVPECFPAGLTTPSNQFNGLLELFNNTASPSADMIMGYDGANAIIEYANASTSSALYINHSCGKDVFINTGSNGGNVSMTTPTLGKVGIGTFTPTQKFDVVGGFSHFTFNTTTIPTSDAAGGLTLGWNASGGGAEVNLYNVYSVDPDNTIAFRFAQKIASGTTTSDVRNLLTIRGNGNVGIGTDLTGGDYDNSYKLAVNGNIRTKKVVVETGWSDFVFEKNYKLKTIEEIEQYIKQNGHLSEMPSAKDIETNGGDVGELLKLQMQKIEELTLYIIELNKRIELLEKK